MFSGVFLAVTEKEMEEIKPKNTAFLSCHFSPYSKGLSNLPTFLPPGSLLLLDDSMPADGHDPKVVRKQLEICVKNFSIKGVLLDFQNLPTEEGRRMAALLAGSLPCPVAVTPAYAKALGCPVFLPPPPVNQALQDYLAPWRKQGVYLEIAPEGLLLTVTEQGCRSGRIPPVYDLPMKNKHLQCHYRTEVFPEKAVFTLCRNKEDLQALVRKAENLGVLGTVGLYWELQAL